MSVQETRRLIRLVTEDRAANLSVDDIETYLETIKTNGRVAEVSENLLHNDIELIVSNFIVTPISQLATVEAYTIVANALLINQNLLKSYDPKNLINSAIKEYSKSSSHSKLAFILFRILFLCTFTGLELDRKSVQSCASIVSAKISEVAVAASRKPETVTSPIFIECLKLTFNILHHYPEYSLSSLEGPVCRKLIHLLCVADSSDPANQHFYQQVTNFLLCIPVDTWMYSNDSPCNLLTSLCLFQRNSILLFSPVDDNSAHQSDLSLVVTNTQDQTLSPQLSLFHTVVSSVFSYNCPVALAEELRSIAQEHVLPSVLDRQNVLGKSDSLSGCLIRIASNPLVKTSRNIIFDILWIVSNEDSDEFVQNFGLGFASSFLASHGIAFPGSIATDSMSNTSSRKSSAVTSEDVNLVTGQFKSHECRPKVALEEMTEEEKLQDAERLFVLFERLKANNVIQVENPVATAAREGRLREFD